MTAPRPTAEQLAETTTAGTLLLNAEDASKLGFDDDAKLYMAAARIKYLECRDTMFQHVHEIINKFGPTWDKIQQEKAATAKSAEALKTFLTGIAGEEEDEKQSIN